MTARFLIGDSLSVLRTLPDASVDLVLSSPPFLALRSYLPADHPDKDKEMGSEATPGEFIDALVVLIEECARVLAPHGSLVFELGDTYAGSGGAGGDYTAGGLKDGQQAFVGSSSLQRTMTKNARVQTPGHNGSPIRDLHGKSQPGGEGWPLDKSLTLIPEILRFTLAYGFNPLTGRKTDRWRIRNVHPWLRPNPPVGALGDKMRPATSYLFSACKSRKRYFDLDAVRSEVKDQRYRTTNGPKQNADPSEVLTANYHQRVPSNPAGAPPLDWVLCPTSPYKGSHYATWPPDLLPRFILSGCPQRVCTTCGEPSRRIVEDTPGYAEVKAAGGMLPGDAERAAAAGQSASKVIRATCERATTGWTDCGHDSWRQGLVLDPFAGSGTTLAVATGHGRDAIGIDLDERNADLAAERVGMFLTIERPEVAA